MRIFKASELVHPTEKQKQFLNLMKQKRFVLYGGAAGGGKSYILRWWLVLYLIELASRGIKKAQVGLFCEDYPTLHDRQISKIKTEFPGWLGRLKQGDTREFVLNECLGGGTIALRNLDDPSKYLSSEFAAIAVDELTLNADKQTFDALRLRLRWQGVPEPRFAAGTNPGGPGHAWVKKLWIDRDFPFEMLSISEQFAFLQATAYDNTEHLSEQYYDDLKSQPEKMRAAYLDGNWDTFAGQYFDNFPPYMPHSPHKHCLPSVEIKPWWSRWMSMDWGFEDPSVVHWHAQSEEGVIYTYREMVVNHTTPDKVAEQALAETPKDEKIEQFFLSPDAFARKQSDDTIAVQIDDVLAKERRIPPTQRADDDRVGGWMLMYQLLNAGRWKILDCCRELIDSIPLLVHNEGKQKDHKRREDIAPSYKDHAPDCARYGLKSRLTAHHVPLETRVEERIKTSDPTSQAIWRSKFKKQERDRYAPKRFTKSSFRRAR